jgi:hypothetical protein
VRYWSVTPSTRTWLVPSVAIGSVPTSCMNGGRRRPLGHLWYSRPGRRRYNQWLLEDTHHRQIPMERPTEKTPRLCVTDQHSQAEADRAAWRACTPEERLDAVEALRLQAGKFVYEYPTRLRRLLTVTREPSR